VRYADQEVQARHQAVPGWFGEVDCAVFGFALDWQARHGITGDLLEIGVYRGKSAVLLGWHVQPGERLVVCDPFGAAVGHVDNQAENDRAYPGLHRTLFEQQYLEFHAALPVVAPVASDQLRDAVLVRPTRFVHVDGSHLFDQVVRDLQIAAEILVLGGVVVCDDFRGEHTPGVALAAWQSVLAGRFRVLCLTAQKLYLTAGVVESLPDDLESWADAHPALAVERVPLSSHDTLRVWQAEALRRPSAVLATALLPPAAKSVAVRARTRWRARRGPRS
jgi:hypothetical protein